MTNNSRVLLAMVMMAGNAPAQQPTRTVQQDFEAAAALDAGADKAAALAAWEALERRTVNNRRSHAIVLVRKSAALVKLDRRDEAVSAARAGLADLPATDPTLREDRRRAYTGLGFIAEGALDYAGAAESFKQAEAISETPGEKMGSALALLRVQTFTDPVAATQAAARADAVVAVTAASKPVLGELAMREAVLALNRGDIPAARSLSAASVTDFGGMTDRIDLRDVSARSTAAIVSLLDGKREDARRYMAMTGAGRTGGDGFGQAVQMRVPDCGGDAGLKPDDFAIVEFSIGDDGSVIDVAPVYAQGGGTVALEFARVVQGWSWTPEQVKALPIFYRYNARVEMRCSLGYERPSIVKVMRDELAAWLADKGVTLPPRREGADAASVAGQRAALAAADAKDARSLAALAALYPLITNSVVGREETNALATRAYAIAVSSGAPPVALLDLDLAVRRTAHAEGRRSRDYRRSVSPLLTTPAYANDPQARSVLRLALADGDDAQPRQLVLLRQIADDGGLARNDPLRVAALVRIASLEQQANDPVAARAAFEQSGLTANQCALLDAPPKLVSAGGTYPTEAREWGFEGWTRTQFDVAADGRVLNERAIISYPPFIFTQAGTKTVAGARYAKTFRPDGGLGCGARVQGVSFKFGR